MSNLVQHFQYQQKLILILTVTILFTIATNTLLAQNTGVIMGKVTDNNTQEALIGVSVILEGTDPLIGATSDVDGKFKISAPVGSYNISASYVGYIKSTKFNIVLNSGNAYMVNFVLVEDRFQLDEVKVVADRRVSITTLETPLSIQRVTS
ncbi:MAG: carboxypeptidase-like regulatory domain-containing protein, partial [Bacteroidetes bacterium]|nr:carboxypeptidase-like regulatory domain-containing protein [Bacteroidota bacterium]